MQKHSWPFGKYSEPEFRASDRQSTTRSDGMKTSLANRESAPEDCDRERERGMWRGHYKDAQAWTKSSFESRSIRLLCLATSPGNVICIITIILTTVTIITIIWTTASVIS